MAWAKLDDQFFYNKKIAQVDGPAKLLYIASLVYTANQLTDGFLPERAVRFIASTADVANCQEFARQLLDVGLWDATDDGYQIHDYLEWNPSKEQVEQTREARAASGRRGGLAKAANAKQNASKMPSKPLAKSQQKSAPSPSLVNNYNTHATPENGPISDAVTAFQNNIHMIANPIQAEEISSAVAELQARGVLDWWNSAIKIACDNNARSWAYVRAIVENALKDGKPPGTNKPSRNGNKSHVEVPAEDWHD